MAEQAEEAFITEMLSVQRTAEAKAPGQSLNLRDHRAGEHFAKLGYFLWLQMPHGSRM
jgi:hypothetical protein